ncbi:MAG: TRAP transporter TatT component family protein [Pyrinomonadaceae bacterium]
MNRSPQKITERADALYAAREQKERVCESVELLQPLAAQGDYEAAWRLCRALFFLGQEASSKVDARNFYARAVSDGEHATKLMPQRVEGQFWLGVNLALLASLENTFKAPRHALRAKCFLQRAVQINPAYHGAGPLRVLARLTHKLPRLLGGSVTRAHALYEKAIALAPANTVTRIYFAEMLFDMRNKKRARLELAALLDAPLDPAWAFETKRDRRLAHAMLKAIDEMKSDWNK